MKIGHNFLSQTFKTEYEHFKSCKNRQDVYNDTLNTHTLALVLREFVWKELVDFKHRFHHSSALSQHPHDELKDGREGGANRRWTMH